MDLSLTDDTALVVASSRGLGRGTAAALANEGANVVVNGRNESAVQEAVAHIEANAPGSVHGIPADITRPEATRLLVEETVDTFGGLDHLVTNAGGVTPGSTLETTDDDWYDAVDLLLMSVVRLVRQATPHLRSDGGGSIVMITSLAVKEATTDIVLSSSVRMGVVGLEKVLARELAPAIRANAVLPGSHETGRSRELLERAVADGEYESYDYAREAVAADIPVGRMGRPTDLGNVVTFLCSERAAFVNGAAIPIDGGASRSTL